MKHHYLATRAAAVGAIAALALSACAAQPAAEQDTVLDLGLVTPLTSFAPWEASWANQSPYLQAVYDTVLRAEADGTIVEGLATAWEWDDSKTQLTLTIRDGVLFSDGSALTAQSVADSLLRFKDGTSENASFFTGLLDATASDDSTVVVTLQSPDPAFLIYLTQNAGLVGAEAMYDAADAQTTPIGSGPYELDAAGTVVGSSYVFSAKDDYWDADSVHYDEIVITVYGDPTSLMNAIKGGQVDATASQTPTQIPEAEAAGYTANIAESNWSGFLLVDRNGTINPAMGDVRVRQAINYALDREGLVQALAGGYGTPTTQVFSTLSAAYDPELDSFYTYDPEKAKELLAEAGYADGFTLLMPSNNFVPESEFAIYKEQLGAVGITVEWQTTGDDLFPRMLGGEWAAFPFLLQADPTAWQAMQFSMLPWSPWNTSHVEDPQILGFMGALSTAEGDEADAIAHELNTYIVEQAWFAPVMRQQGAFFTNATTVVELQAENVVPYLWNISPAS
jgi:peptide/nickel transport system substrate-binding protein